MALTSNYPGGNKAFNTIGVSTTLSDFDEKWRLIGKSNQGGTTEYFGIFSNWSGSQAQDYPISTMHNTPIDTGMTSTVTTTSRNVLGASQAGCPLWYNHKSYMDELPAGSSDAARSYFGKAVYNEIFPAVGTSNQSAPYTNAEGRTTMIGTYLKGAWVSGPGGFANLIGNSTLLAYWNFEDITSWNHGTLATSVNDKSGNGHTLTIGGSTLTHNSLYEDTAPWLGGWELAQNNAAGANYATCTSTISAGTTDYTIIGYLGERGNNTTAARYAWDARNGGGDWMQTVSGGDGWNFNNAVSGGQTSATATRHIMTVIASPNGNDSYGYVSTPSAFNQNIFQGVANNGANQIGSNFRIGTNNNNVGSQMWPGSMSQFFIVSVSGAEGIDEAIKVNQIIHYHFRGSLAASLL